MGIVCSILIVLGWVMVALGAFGVGVNITVGSLSPVTTGIAFVLAGLTARLKT